MDALLLQIGLQPGPVSSEAAGAISYFVAWLGVTIALLGVAAILAWVAPAPLLERVYRTLRAETSRSIALGLVLAIGVPVSIVAYTLSVLLLPLGIATAMLAPALAAVGYLTGGWLLGRALAARRGVELDARGRVTWSVIGVGILRVLGLVPGVDLLVAVVASTVGIGALIAAFDRTGSLRPRGAGRGEVRTKPEAHAAPEVRTYERPAHA